MDRDQIIEAVKQKLEQRSARGLLKYGTPLTRSDLSHLDWLEHAQEEFLDGANYLERLIWDEKGLLAQEQLPESSISENPVYNRTVIQDSLSQSQLDLKVLIQDLHSITAQLLQLTSDPVTPSLGIFPPQPGMWQLVSDMRKVVTTLSALALPERLDGSNITPEQLRISLNWAVGEMQRILSQIPSSHQSEVHPDSTGHFGQQHQVV
jgi:hypothetical protein